MPSLERTPKDTPSLVSRLIAGDASVLGDILNQFGPEVSGILWTRFQGMLDYTDIEDAMSLGLEQLWNKRDRYSKNRSPLNFWYYLLCRNAAVDRLRQRASEPRLVSNVEQRLLDQISSYEPDEGPDDSPEVGAPALEQSERLLTDLTEVIAALPSQDRMILLAYMEADEGNVGMSGLAARLNKSHGAVRAKKLRIFEKLRVELEKRGHFLRRGTWHKTNT